VQGSPWVYLPEFLIQDESRNGRLLSIAGRHLKGGRVELTAARRRDFPHGPVANRLWEYVGEKAARFSAPA